MKKALSLLLVLVMLIGMMPMQVFATEGTQDPETVEVVTETTEPSEAVTLVPTETEEQTESSYEEEETQLSEPSSESEEEAVVVHEHSYTTEVTAPTCTEQGYTTYTCDCGDSYVDDYVNATGEHTYENGICTGCGATDPEQAAPEGEVISILGDSISTFAGFLPEGNATYYPKSTVQSVADTWWMQLITELDANLGVNDSWSGSYVSAISGERLPMASLERIRNLGSNGTPDVILFFGGTNDIAFKCPLGSFDSASAPKQADLNATSWESLADGYTAAILRMQHFYPEARIISILPTINKSYYNNATLEQHNAVLRAICTHYGVEYVDLVAAGFTATMLGDATHPNAEGMDFITSAVKTVYTAETPNDCADGHQFGDWTECTSFTCQKRYMRECVACGEKQYAKDISAQTIPFAVPAITANVGDLVNLSLYSVAFDAASVIPAAELVWTGEVVEDGCVIPDAAGVYALTASDGENSKTVYLVAKNPEDAEYVLYYDDFDNAALDGYRAIEVPSGTEYYVSDGKLILDATGNSTNHMRILLPEWIGDFGNYEITTSFSMQKAMADTYWFAVMARIQNNDFPYWQAAIRQNATASNGVEISTRTKASGASSGWTVTHKTAMGEKLSASKYYTQTFALSGKNGFHAVNGTTLLESNAITHVVGDVGFHLRASKVAVDSIKIVIAANDTAHSFGDWTIIREATCTEAGEESRTCGRCGTTENREIVAGHNLTKYEQKLPTCTESGWKAYEACSRCDYTTYVEVAATGHTFEREIHSVAHRGYSDAAPENTLIAYRMAKENGFRYVECDVSLTSDKKAVLLHDDTINRTSDGSGKITSLTYEQLLQYDFGSWKGEEFTGTKIPTLEEFLALCVELDLHPYIELKTSGYTKAEIITLVRLAESFGLQDDCTWISFNATYLGYIKAADPTARLGYLRNDNATTTVINTAKKLRTEKNEVFLDLAYAKLTEAGLLYAEENGFAVEVWTVDDENTIKNLSASISGVTSNMLVAEKILKNAQVTPPTCTEQGYTTYTCTCGESYVDNYVDPTGEHTYENGVCVSCGASQIQSVVITKQPVPATAAIGEKATVFVEAEGEGLTYQWFYRDAGKTEFTKSTITNSNYTLTVKELNRDRVLYCVITDANGNQVTTDTVRLLQPLAEELKILTQPASTYALIGEKATVSIEVQGVGLSYQWYYRDLPDGSLSKSSNTTADYSLTVKPTYVNREIYCVITDAHGNKVTTDTVKLLQPLRESLEIIKQPVSSTATIGEIATVSVEAKGEGLTYQWYFRNTPTGALSKSSITGSSYSVTVTKANAQRVVYCVITDGHGNKVTTETVALRMDAPAEEPKVYFASLNDALTGIGGSTTPAGAVARVDKDSYETVITLLDNTVLTETLTVAEDAVLDLNGFAVSSDIFPMIHVKNGTCSILNGSILLTSDGSGTTSAPAVAITVDSDAGLQASNSTVVVTDAANSTVIGISTAAGSSLVLTETDVTVTTGKSLNNAGIHAKGTAVLTGCSVIAESDYTGANGAYTSSAKGILAEDDLELYNCYVWGPHSGVNTLGNLYVDGGTYEGYGHGAFYISGEGSTNYIYNATIRWATMRAGTVADSVAGTNHSAMYIGYANNITTYFDGCTFIANRSSTKSYCIVLRNSSGESNNCVYVSNSSFKNYNKYAYRSNDVPVERRLFAYSGVGNTYATTKVFQYVRNGFYTNESYDQWRK